MGFGIRIQFSLQIDPRTGKPYVYYVNRGFLDKKPFHPEEYVIPWKYHNYIEQSGYHFQSYIRDLDNTSFTAYPREIIMVYPDWNTVKLENDLLDDDYWNEKNHNEFTTLKIYNGTPKGRPIKVSRATLPINELKGNPPTTDCPISNLHRCKEFLEWMDSKSFGSCLSVFEIHWSY